VAEHYVVSIAELAGDLNRLVTENEQKQIDKEIDKLLNEGVSADLALKIAQIVTHLSFDSSRGSICWLKDHCKKS
jgi:NAD-specific glutamate dehydrogenase